MAQGQSRSVLERETCFRHFWPASAGSRNGETWQRAREFHRLSARALRPGTWLTSCRTGGAHGPANYLLPLTISWTRLELQAERAARRIRRGSREGTLLDATADRTSLRLLEKLRASATIETDQGRIEFSHQGFEEWPDGNERRPEVDTEQSNTTVVVEVVSMNTFSPPRPPGG